MNADDEFQPDHLHAVTIGKHGFWAAELTWTEGESDPVKDYIHGELEGYDNIACDLFAAQQAIRQAAEMGVGVTIYSANESSVETATERLPFWQSNGWKNSQGKRPSHISIWKDIADLSSKTEVEWCKREKGKLDDYQLYSQLSEEIEDQRNSEDRRRAIDRDQS